jgi:hypothetical protein
MHSGHASAVGYDGPSSSGRVPSSGLGQTPRPEGTGLEQRGFSQESNRSARSSHSAVSKRSGFSVQRPNIVLNKRAMPSLRGELAYSGRPSTHQQSALNSDSDSSSGTLGVHKPVGFSVGNDPLSDACLSDVSAEYPYGITSKSWTDPSFLPYEGSENGREWDCDSAMFTVSVGDLDHILGPLMNLVRHSPFIATYPSNLMIHLGNVGSANIFVVRLEKYTVFTAGADCAQRQAFVNALCKVDYIALLGGGRDHFLKVPIEVPSIIVSLCLERAGYTHVVYRWFCSKIPYVVASKLWDPYMIRNPYAALSSYFDIGFTVQLPDITFLTCLSPSGLDAGIDPTVYEMANGILGTLDDSVGGSITLIYDRCKTGPEGLVKVLMYPHLVHALKLLTEGQWKNAHDSASFKARVIMLFNLFERVKDFLSTGGYRVEARWALDTLSYFSGKELPATMDNFLTICDLRRINLQILTIPKQVYLDNAVRFIQLADNVTGKLTKHKTHILAASYNAIGFNKTTFKGYLYLQHDKKAIWKVEPQKRFLVDMGMYDIPSSDEDDYPNDDSDNDSGSSFEFWADKSNKYRRDFSDLKRKLFVKHHFSAKSKFCWVVNGGCGPAFTTYKSSAHTRITLTCTLQRPSRPATSLTPRIHTPEACYVTSHVSLLLLPTY